MPTRATSVKLPMGRLWKRFRQWDAPSQIALGLALLLLLLALNVAAWGPAALRPFALVGAFGCLVVGQGVVMWANRDMVTTYTRAQRLYMAEDFAGACALLEDMRTRGRADVRVLTLLGNAYRQRAMLDESAAVLQEALSLQPDFHFPLYGFGRTLLIQGSYAEAAAQIEQALAQGGPPVIQLDAGEAYFRLGRFEDARQRIEAGLTHTSEAYRVLMARYLLYRMDQGAVPDAALLASALPYWSAQAERYAFTAYGQALTEDIRAMQAFSEEA